jgi:hypothetical protein
MPGHDGETVPAAKFFSPPPLILMPMGRVPAILVLAGPAPLVRPV